MRSISLVQFARFKPLAAWSVSASLLGASLALFTGGGPLFAPYPMLLAIACVVLMQYVAHPMNDVMDLELDQMAPIGPTGRFKPLVDGTATIQEVNYLMTAIVLTVLLIMAYLIVLQPILLLPASYGMVALFGYNHKRLRWAYKPFAELYLGVPINVMSVLVISFIGSGEITQLSVAVSLVFGFASGAFFVSMMSMDYPTDRINGKVTTVVRWPRVRYCTGFTLFGLAVTVGSIPTFVSQDVWLAIPSVALSVTTFTVLAVLGYRVDDLRFRFLAGEVERPEGTSGSMRLGQLYTTVVFSIALSAFLLAGAWLG